MSTVVAGVDFGTLSVRVSLVDSDRGPIGSGTAEYPLHRKKEDPDFATQRHADHMEALVLAMRKALTTAGVNGRDVAAMALDTTGSSVVPVGKNLQPLDDYYLWCDHRAWKEAAQITEVARARNLKAIQWCGGVYSSEWGFAKLLHWLRNNPEKRKEFVTALEHCDMVAATLSGVTDPQKIPRSVCAMGHKWMWNRLWGGFPDNDFFCAVDPLLNGIAAKLPGRYETSDHIAGELSVEWAEKLGLKPGLPIPVGAFDAHWDTIGAGARLYDLVNVIGTSTCIVGISDSTELVPGVCGVVPGSVHPQYTGIEAGLSATGDIFEAIARRAGISLSELSKKVENFRAGQTGLLRMTWDNGDRTVLVNPELGGVTLGWKLTHGPEDELFSAIEGTGFHTRVILQRMEENSVTIRRVINGGGIPQKNRKLNQIYADILNKPVLVPEGDVTSLGSAIFAFLAAGTFPTIEKAQDALCRKFTAFEPDPKSSAVYAELYPLYRKLYFSLGQKDSPAAAIGDVLPELRRISATVWSRQ
ncbi:MAG TPA: ribulokinase [Candidatus Acidoferrum sp.]|nr:ribulokinase [Candidatus Acidoferrum sp.]